MQPKLSRAQEMFLLSGQAKRRHLLAQLARLVGYQRSDLLQPLRPSLRCRNRRTPNGDVAALAALGCTGHLVPHWLSVGPLGPHGRGDLSHDFSGQSIHIGIFIVLDLTRVHNPSVAPFHRLRYEARSLNIRVIHLASQCFWHLAERVWG